ncbi:MAG: polymer-forming cytoskeletal protein [Xanthomonadales bacterium]|nr:polymer-forming cytoskeletal protein [Xanthomonadales bacterium]
MAMFDKHKGSKEPTPETVEASKASKAPPPAPRPAEKASGNQQRVAMIGSGISVAGDVTADSNLKVEGLIEGRSVQSSHDIEVAESGKVIANIDARVVRIGGEVTGDESGAEKVIIVKSGRVLGNIVAPRVQLEDGALFRGSIDMNPAPVSEVKKAADKAGGGESAVTRPAAAVAKRPEAASGASKEPGLTLKSG